MAAASVHFSMRIPRRIALELNQFAKRSGISTSAAAAQLLKESLRMAVIPGIDFRWTPTGRRAHVTGTGLSVWELNMIFCHHRGNVRQVLKRYPRLTAAQVEAAVSYAREYGDEKPPSVRSLSARTFRA